MKTIIPLIVLAIFIFSDLYVYFFYYKSLIKNIIGRILFFLPSIILLGGIFILGNMSADGDLFFRKYQSYFLLASLFFVIPKLLFMLFSILDRLTRWVFRSRKFRFFTYIGILVAFAGIYVLIKGTWFDRDRLEIKYISIFSDKIPDGFCKFRILQISDLHLGNLVNKEKTVSELVLVINEEKPDMIVITGDLVNQYAKELDGLESLFAGMKAEKGIFSILGNHDYADYVQWESKEAKAENLEQLIKKQQDFGWIVLKNEATIIHKGSDSLAVIGVENWGEPPFSVYGNLDQAMQSVENISFKVLLTHNPTHWEKEVVGKKDIFLTFSGHTHAMQLLFKAVGMNISPASLKYKYWKGLYTENEDQYLHVNLGIGYVGVPFRFGARPEISIIELNCKSKKEEPAVTVTDVVNEETISN